MGLNRSSVPICQIQYRTIPRYYEIITPLLWKNIPQFPGTVPHVPQNGRTNRAVRTVNNKSDNLYINPTKHRHGRMKCASEVRTHARAEADRRPILHHDPFSFTFYFQQLNRGWYRTRLARCRPCRTTFGKPDTEVPYDPR